MSNTLPAGTFDFDPRTRVVFEAGGLSKLGSYAREILGNNKSDVFLVTDAGLAEAGHESRAVESLQAAGLNVTIYDDVLPNPTTEDVANGLKAAQENNVDLIIGLGGGSSMDCAKGINFLLTNGGQMEDYHGVGKATQPMKPFLAVPTTSGTGSEAQSFAVIGNPVTHMKMACGDKKAAAKIALLDPELTITMPKAVTTTTGIDAISHAVETYVTTKRTSVSKIFSRSAWQKLATFLPAVLDNPNDTKARGEMQFGAFLAGSAIENSMLGATHALANPLTAHFNTTHGIAIGILLPHVIRYNEPTVGRLYGELAGDIGLCSPTDSSATEKLAKFITDIVKKCELPTSLEEIEIDPELIPVMAEEASKQWTGQFNPRPVDVPSLEEIYRCAFTKS